MWREALAGAKVPVAIHPVGFQFLARPIILILRAVIIIPIIPIITVRSIVHRTTLITAMPAADTTAATAAVLMVAVAITVVALTAAAVAMAVEGMAINESFCELTYGGHR